MPHGIASAAQMAMMTRVLDAYCERFAVPENSAEREQVALEILVLFDNGLRDEEALLAALI